MRNGGRTKLRWLLFAVASCAAAAPSFDTVVAPVLQQNCSMCHNEKLFSGGLNLAVYLGQGSVAASRDAWERIAEKLRTGEMPPKGIPRPPAEKVTALLAYVEAEFDRADRAAK